MSEICKKYNIGEDQFRNMVRDGIISTTYPHYDEIYTDFKNNLAVSGDHGNAVYVTSLTHGCDISTVYKILKLPCFQ